MRSDNDWTLASGCGQICILHYSIPDTATPYCRVDAGDWESFRDNYAPPSTRMFRVSYDKWYSGKMFIAILSISAIYFSIASIMVVFLAIVLIKRR